jgi:hypothetical protein
MNDSWFRDYVLLAFRLDKALHAVSEHSPFVDYYYGPPDWKAQVAAEPLPQASALLRQALDLAEAVSCLDLEPQRMIYLSKQVLAMQTICQKLCGETFTLEEELQHCFDLHLPQSRTPEMLFEDVWARAEEKLPGTGDMQRRLRKLEERLTLPPERAEQMVDLLRHALAEAQRRTRTFLDLSANESISIQAIRGQRWMANNQFQGQAYSRIDINLDTLTYLPNLPTSACHEGYPGHHTEYVLKELHLFQERGYVEQAIGLLMAPQATNHQPAKQAEQTLAYLQRPFREAYIFTCTAGAELMRPLLLRTDRHTVFARFLTEPITPSALLG